MATCVFRWIGKIAEAESMGIPLPSLGPVVIRDHVWCLLLDLMCEICLSYCPKTANKTPSTSLVFGNSPRKKEKTIQARTEFLWDFNGWKAQCEIQPFPGSNFQLKGHHHHQSNGERRPNQWLRWMMCPKDAQMIQVPWVEAGGIFPCIYSSGEHNMTYSVMRFLKLFASRWTVTVATSSNSFISWSHCWYFMVFLFLALVGDSDGSKLFEQAPHLSRGWAFPVTCCAESPQFRGSSVAFRFSSHLASFRELPEKVLEKALPPGNWRVNDGEWWWWIWWR